MELGFQNFSQASSLQGLNRFQDMYYPPHLYETPRTTEKPPSYYSYQSKVTVPYEGFSDRVYGTGASGGSHGGGGGGNTAALQALGLLSFLFFLNLIQTSILNSRMNMTAATSTGLLGIGRSGSLQPQVTPFKLPSIAEVPSPGKKRQRRSDPLNKETPLSAAFEPNDDVAVGQALSPLKGPAIQKTSPNLEPGSMPTWKLSRFKRQVNVTGTLVPVKCLVQFYFCSISRRVNLNKKRLLTNGGADGFSRRFVILPVRDASGRSRIVKALISQRTSVQKSCRVLFNECRNATITAIQRPLLVTNLFAG